MPFRLPIATPLLASLLLGSAGHAAAAGAPAAATVWFEVAQHGARAVQSWLLPLSDPGDIAAARAELAVREAGGQGALVVARFRPGGDGLNRNLRDPLQRRWSWHAVEFLEFADLSIELCDGSPALVEADPESFAANTDGVICFWGYSIAAELPAPPTMPVVEALDGFWHAPGSEGSGFLIDVLAEQQTLALAWLRYTPSGDAQPAQQWLIGLGSLPGDADQARGIRLDLAQPAPAVNGEVPMVPVVEASLEFHDCNRATLAVHGAPPATLELVRSLPRYACGPQ